MRNSIVGSLAGIRQPSVAIIIVNWNGYELTKACLKSLQKISYSNYSIILVDNASNDKSVELLKSQFTPLVCIENNQNLGFTGGNNVGIVHALGEKSDYVLLLNNDTKVQNNFLEPMVRFLENNPQYAGAQPKILYEGERDILWNSGGGYFKWMEMTWSIGIGKKDSSRYNIENDTDWITGCCFLVKSSCIRQIGLLDKEYFAYYEDVDWSFRMRKGGFRLRYIPEAVIYHVAGASSLSKKKSKEGHVHPIIHYYRIRNHIFLIRSHANWLSFTFSLVYQTAKNSLFIFFFLLRGRNEKAKAVWKGYWDGLLSIR